MIDLLIQEFPDFAEKQTLYLSERWFIHLFDNYLLVSGIKHLPIQKNS